MGDYKGQIGLSPPAAYPSTVGCRHIRRFPCTRAPRLCTRKLPISPRTQTLQIDKQEYRQPRSNDEPPPQPLFYFYSYKSYEWLSTKLDMLRSLYASSYIMIIIWKLYSSSYALLYKWYESMNMEELFIVLFIPNLLFLPRRQALQVAFALLSNTTKN